MHVLAAVWVLRCQQHTAFLETLSRRGCRDHPRFVRWMEEMESMQVSLYYSKLQVKCHKR